MPHFLYLHNASGRSDYLRVLASLVSEGKDLPALQETQV